jgi:hypothetical protein
MSQVLTGNRLADGAVVYWAGGATWVERVAGALALKEPAQLEAAREAESVAIADRLVASAYLMDVTFQDGVPAPLRMREIIRAAGPSVRLDLGKQAER